MLSLMANRVLQSVGLRQAVGCNVRRSMLRALELGLLLALSTCVSLVLAQDLNPACPQWAQQGACQGSLGFSATWAQSQCPTSCANGGAVNGGAVATPNAQAVRSSASTHAGVHAVACKCVDTTDTM